jgi:hypothetical protein
MSTLDHKVLKKKNLGKELTLKITKSEAAERIFVQFASKDGKLLLERNFQDTFYGRQDAEKFEDTIKSVEDLQAYFNRRK